MAALNRVVLVGRIVRDPELKRTNSGTSVTSFTVAVDNMTKNGGEKSASFIPCTCWNKTAENVAKYCSKGSLVGVDGRLNQRSYQDRNNQKRSVVEVVAENVEFLERKGSTPDSAASGNPATPSSSNNNNDSANASATQQGIDSADDDLPF
ncbi:MAG: single-stranded DNA-binding protein [Bacilli bacterium]|jgi:single-strand DNA-binding protein|nr:single-stranded DNA-binding protein [Bacilli bacterium]